ncbi:hypothetical protein FF38_11044 [Lucilia cuprina]|uniref:Peptidase A1 domain-containing protein n=1 Tax=Lucilia cuprina TaxID=7375 RepID=A0A0L0CDI6_LUCCU|nr:hypothetical protein FF38_11044 [Lucilia cuprina]
MQIISALLSALPLAAASPVPNDGSIPGVVHMPVSRVKHQDVGNVHMPHLNNKLDEDGKPVKLSEHAQVIEGLANQRYFYKAEVNIGTPPQNLSLLVDTGSSDTWVFTANTEKGRGSKQDGFIFGLCTLIFTVSECHTMHFTEEYQSVLFRIDCTNLTEYKNIQLSITSMPTDSKPSSKIIDSLEFKENGLLWLPETFTSNINIFDESLNYATSIESLDGTILIDNCVDTNAIYKNVACIDSTERAYAAQIQNTLRLALKIDPQDYLSYFCLRRYPFFDKIMNLNVEKSNPNRCVVLGEPLRIIKSYTSRVYPYTPQASSTFERSSSRRSGVVSLIHVSSSGLNPQSAKT